MRRHDLREVNINEVYVSPERRNAESAKVAALADSIKSIGLMTPISVKDYDGDGEFYWHLVAGRHRLEAAKSMGWAKIEAIVIDGSEIEARLWEIDENLARAELTPAEVAELSVARRDLWRELQAQVGQAVPPTKPQYQKQFAAETAAATGRSKRDINRAISRGEKIAPDVLQAVRGTDRDKGVVLDRLAKMTPTEQRAEIAKPIAPPPVEPLNDIEISNKFRRRLAAAWNSTPPSDREWFRDWIDTPNAKWTGRSAA